MFFPCLETREIEVACEATAFSALRIHTTVVGRCLATDRGFDNTILTRSTRWTTLESIFLTGIEKNESSNRVSAGGALAKNLGALIV